LLHVGVVVLVESEGLDDFPGEVSIARESAGFVFEPLAGLPEEPADAAGLILRALRGESQ
jgi:hypothetical protein